jgi:chromosome segregation ATPase
MADVPKRLGNQGNMINKLLDTKDIFVSRSESLGADMKALSEKLSGLQAAQAGMDQRMAAQESRFSEGLDKQRDYLVSAKDELSRHVDREISAIRKALEKKSQEESRSTLAEFKAEMKRLSGAEEELKVMKKYIDTSFSRLQGQVAELQSGLKEANPELKLLESRLRDMEKAYKELSAMLAEASEFHKSSDSAIKADVLRYVDGSLKALKKELEERRSLDAKAQLGEFKDELRQLESLGQEISSFRSAQEKRTDDLEQEVSSLSGPLTDLKALLRRVSELEDIMIASDKRMDAEKDRRTEQLGVLDKRSTLLEKALSDLASSQKQLEKRIASDNEKLQKALSGVMADKQSLEKEFGLQKGKMLELIKELKSL